MLHCNDTTGWCCEEGARVTSPAHSNRAGVISTAPDTDREVKVQWDDDGTFSGYLSSKELRPADATATGDATAIIGAGAASRARTGAPASGTTGEEEEVVVATAGKGKEGATAEDNNNCESQREGEGEGERESGFDLIIASDLLYNATEDTWPQLAETLATICRGGGQPPLPGAAAAGAAGAGDTASGGEGHDGEGHDDDAAVVDGDDGSGSRGSSGSSCIRGKHRESMVLLGFQIRSSVLQHDFFKFARLYFDIAPLAVPSDTIASIVEAQEEVWETHLNLPFAPFYAKKCHHFTKTGSGQT